MSLNDLAVLFMGGYVVVMVAVGLLITLRPGAGPAAFYLPVEEERIRLRQQRGVMPRKAWGFVPAVRHSHYDPAPWQLKTPRSEEDSLENVERATDIKRDLGSEHPAWERLDRQGV
jgi:hypothetical protein